MNRPPVFIDADVIFAGSAAPREFGASQVVLAMGEMTLLACITSNQAVAEAERNLAEKLPAAVPTFRRLVQRCLTVVDDPSPAETRAYAGQADLKDLPILVAAIKHGCAYLLTFNTRHFHPLPGLIVVQRPGDFLRSVRAALDRLLPDVSGAEDEAR